MSAPSSRSSPPTGTPSSGASSTSDRRSFLKLATIAVGGAASLAMAVPLLRYFLAPVGKRTVTQPGGPVDVLAADKLPADGHPVQVAIFADAQRDAWSRRERVPVGSAWLRRGKDGAPEALSAICPHLGCAVGYDRSDGLFHCPCHKSSFAKDGSRLEGPAKRGLDPLPCDVQDGRVRVTFRRFRADVAEREEV